MLKIKFHSVVAVILSELLNVPHRLPFFDVVCHSNLGEFKIEAASATLYIDIIYCYDEGSEKLYVDLDLGTDGFSTVDGDEAWPIEDIGQFVKCVLECAVVS